VTCVARRLACLVAASAVTAALTYALLRSIGLSGIVGIYHDLRWSIALGFPLLWLVASVARAEMYRWLLERRVGMCGLVPLMWVRGLVVDLVPARMGLATIPAALRLVWGIEVSEGVGVLAGVTVVEFAALGVLVLAVCTLAPAPEVPMMHSMLIGVGAALVIVLPAAVFLGRRAQALEGRGGFSATIAKLAVAVAALGRRDLVLTVMAWSLLTRLAKYAGLYVLVNSMPVPRLSPLSFLAAALAAEATTALPIQGLAGVGTWEAAWVSATTTIGFSTQDAVASAFGLHLAVLGWEILMGGIGLVVLVAIRRRNP